MNRQKVRPPDCQSTLTPVKASPLKDSKLSHDNSSHLLYTQGVTGSNPVLPTIFSQIFSERSSITFSQGRSYSAGGKTKSPLSEGSLR
jgi:hypothetical protein